MDRFAKILSWILSPILIPTYAILLCMWLTPLTVLPTAIKWEVVAVCTILTCVVPALAILILYKLKVISAPGLNNRNERFIPYIITQACYLACAWYLFHIHAPRWMWMFMVGGACAAVLSTIVNIKWKISAHCAAMGGLLALTFRLCVDGLAVVTMWPIIIVVLLLTGALGTSRIWLNCHTFWQVMAGTANGFLWVYLLT